VKNILILSYLQKTFLSLFEFSKKLNQSKDIEVFLYTSITIYKKYYLEITKSEIQIINKNDLEKQLKKRISTKINGSLLKNVNSILSRLPIVEEKKLFINSQKKISYIEELLLKNNIKKVLINGDRQLHKDLLFLKASKNLDIETVIPYLVYFAEEEGLLKTGKQVYNDSLYISLYNKKAQKKFKNHLRKNKFYYSHSTANVLDKLGILPTNPWFMGGGDSDILCLPNDNMKNHYISNGINEDKIKVVGDISYDLLYKSCNIKENIKNSILKKYDMDKSKNILMISLPQLAEHKILSWDEHWIEINFLMENLNKLNQNILISLHPKMNLDNYKFLEKKYNCRILEEKLINVLPISDIFIATYSSTVLWSVLCGIKTIVVDFYNFKYVMYDFLESIVKVEDKKKLFSILNKTLINEQNFDSDWKKLSRDEVFDGKTIERYIKLLKEDKV